MLEEWQATPVGAVSPTPETVELPGKPEALAGEGSIRYVTELDDPRSGDDEVAVLHLNGCYAHSEVELAGSVLGQQTAPVSHDTYFEPLRIPFRPAEECRIAVTCEAPTDRFGGLHDTDRVPEEARVPAPWWEADLETHSLPFIDALSVRADVTDEGAVLHVRTTVVADRQLEERITYSLRPAGDLSTRGTMERATVETAGPGKTTVEHTIEVRDPARWWPRDHGEQHRYTLRASLGDSERAITTGICDVQREEDHLRVNGEAVRIRGVNLTTDEPADVERAAEVNANLVRAHAHVLSPELYEACTEAGLLVWQDLPLTGPGDFDVDRGRALAETISEVYGHQPALAVAAVHDEPTDAFAEGLGSGLMAGLRRRWRAWRTSYDRDPAERVAEAFPDDLPVFPVVGDPGTGAAARRLYPGWDYGEAENIEGLLERYPGDVVAEFGAGAVGSGSGVGAADFEVAKHEARVDDDDAAASQAYQEDVIETVAGALRQDGIGAIAYTLRDTDDAGMGVYAVDGEAKPARDALASAFRPIRGFLVSPEASESEVVVCNDGPVDLDIELTWTAGEEGGSESLSIGASERWRGGPIDLPAGAETVELELGTDAGSTAVEYDRRE